MKLAAELTRNIWNKIIAEPKNKDGHFNFSPAKLKKVIEETLKEIAIYLNNITNLQYHNYY